MTDNINNKESVLVQEWYRIGMVWLVIALPAIVVAASLLTVVIAHKNAPIMNQSSTSHVEASR